MTDYSKLRERMVKRQIAGRGVRSKKVLDAMRKVPRERFLPQGQGVWAYDDGPLPIGDGQTISQPYIVAYMTEALALEGGEKVLEIGTGSGYAAAVLAEIAADVYTIERIEGLADMASAVLDDLGYHNVHVRAGGPDVPDTLQHQLKIGGRLVIPVGTSSWYQELVRVTRVSETEFKTEDLIPVRFVPLIGEEGWGS
jgi:protein-L-isoaspartate(D-aspartate) O-methyltransferase